MPQLSLETFVTQYFWLLVIFFTIFILTSLFIMPKISEILKLRKNLEGNNIDHFNINNKHSKNLLNNYK